VREKLFTALLIAMVLAFAGSVGWLAMTVDREMHTPMP